jgi:hypothetical protein
VFIPQYQEPLNLNACQTWSGGLSSFTDNSIFRFLFAILITVSWLNSTYAKDFVTETTLVAKESNIQISQANSAPDNKITTIQSKITEFLEPEQGLNTEIRTGLLKIEQICLTIKKNSVSTPGLDKKSQSLPTLISQSKELLNSQKINLQSSIDSFKTAYHISSADNSCEKLPKVLRVSNQCRTYQTNLDLLDLVSKTSQSYYSEVSDRYQSYEYALQLEEKGCARPQFAYRLWQAEFEHMVPRLANSSQFFISLLPAN